MIPDVKELLAVGAHFGHSIKRWNPKMDKYIYEARGGVHIFDLFKTRDTLEKAVLYLIDNVAEGKNVIFVGTKGQAVEAIAEEAKKLGISYVTNRWIGGTLTNWGEIKGRIDHLIDMREKMESGGYDKYTKKEKVVLKREMERLDRLFGGLIDLKVVPDIMFVVDPKREKTAVAEARVMGVTVIALADSNADPDMIDYLIPANDDAIKSVELFIRAISDAVEEGQKKIKKSKEAEPEKKTKK